jgi:hypothetical protein
VAAVAIDVALGVTVRPVRVAELGCFLTPLQAASSTQNERIEILSRTYVPPWNRIAPKPGHQCGTDTADTTQGVVKLAETSGTAGRAVVSVRGAAERANFKISEVFQNDSLTNPRQFSAIFTTVVMRCGASLRLVGLQSRLLLLALLLCLGYAHPCGSKAVA